LHNTFKVLIARFDLVLIQHLLHESISHLSHFCTQIVQLFLLHIPHIKRHLLHILTPHNVHKSEFVSLQKVLTQILQFQLQAMQHFFSHCLHSNPQHLLQNDFEHNSHFKMQLEQKALSFFIH